MKKITKSLELNNQKYRIEMSQHCLNVYGVVEQSGLNKTHSIPLSFRLTEQEADNVIFKAGRNFIRSKYWFQHWREASSRLAVNNG